MYDNLNLFQTATAMARHAASRQAVVAQNVANADTPGYRAQEIARFADSYAAGGTLGLRTTRPEHMAGTETGAIARPRLRPSEASPNGNTVSLELEMLQAVDAEREHDRALAIYRHALGVIRTSLGR